MKTVLNMWKVHCSPGCIQLQLCPSLKDKPWKPAQTVNNTSSFKTSFIANIAEVDCSTLGCYIIMLANSRQRGRKLSTLCPDDETVGSLQSSWHLT